MSDTNKPLDDLVRLGDVAMVTTLDADGLLTSRPLTVAAADDAGVSFLVDAGAEWLRHLAAGAQVNVAVANGTRNDWVSISGPARTSADRATVRRLWSAPAKAWFDGPDDERVAALHVPVDHGSFWSAPGGGPLGRVVAVLGAAIGRGDGGNHGVIASDRPDPREGSRRAGS